MKKRIAILAVSILTFIQITGIWVVESRAAEEPCLTFQLKSGQKIFDIDDIVRFDWDKQIFELTRSAAMDFMARLGSVGVEGDKFILKKDDQLIIYEGTLVTPVSSLAFAGPVIRGALPDDNVKPPLFEIGGGYPRVFAERDSRFSERLKKVLQQANVLAEIDVNNPPSPIESVTHGWFGEKNGLRALVEIFSETFQLHRQVRTHIHLTGSKNLDENHVVDVNATLVSNDGGNSFSTHKIFPLDGSDWKNIYVLEMNPWKDTGQLSERIKPGLGKLSVEVSTRKILDERAKTYSEPMENVKTDAINVFVQRGRALLPEMPNKVMIRFQKAIKDSAWAKALEYCSSKIKSKAEEYGSIEAFFNDFLPIGEIRALSGFEISGTRSYNDEVVRYSCDIKLKDPNYKYPLNWNLSVIKEDSKWVVEFPTKLLDIWLKHEVLKMKVANERLRIEPEKNHAGFDVRLIPLTKEFAIGSPMLFRVEMKSISNETLGYWHTSFMVNDPMIVKDSNGTIVPYVDTSYQTIVAPEFVEAGETVIIADNYDVRSQYHITKPGKYIFQFRGLRDAKPSNIVEKYVESRPLSALESIVENILPVLPEGWKLTRRIMSANELAEGSMANEVVWINLIGKMASKVKSNSVIIAVFLHTAAQRIPQVKLKSHLSELEYWGQSRWGLIYGKSHDAEQLWPDYKARIINALDIQKINGDMINVKQE